MSNIANQGVDQRDLCTVITLEMKNALNSAFWQLILEKIRDKMVIESIINIIVFYSSDRTILLETENTTKHIKIKSGGPQRSAIGPTLWHVLHDGLIGGIL